MAIAVEPDVRSRWGAEQRGDIDLAAIGALVGDASRCRVLLALGDGRALPASRLAAEAGVTSATASSHLAKLVDGGLLTVERHGRHRYYRLAGPKVGRLIEVLAELAPAQPVRSLRQGTQARALRDARTCYDHLAGRLGVGVMGAMIDRGLLSGGDGAFDPGQAQRDRLNAYGADVDYCLTPSGQDFVAGLGIPLGPRPLAVRYCVDWSEQRHHLAGPLGRSLLARFIDLEWVVRSASTRAVRLTPKGLAGLDTHLGLRWCE